MSQANDRRQWNIGVNHLAVVLDLLSFAFQQKYNSTPPCTYVKRLV